MDVRTPRVDPQFSELCPRLSDDELAGLRASLKKEGYRKREPILVWPEEKWAIIDGHHRWELCGEEDIVPAIEEVHFDSREEACNWIIDNQLSRRNVTPDQAAYLRGKRYRLEVTKAKAGAQNEPGDGRRISERLGDVLGVSNSTVKRDGDFADAVDKIAKNVGKEAKDGILSGALSITKSQVVDIAAMPVAKQRTAMGSTDGLKQVLHSRRKKPHATTAAPDYLTAAEDIDARLTSLIGRVLSAGVKEELVNRLKTARKLIRMAVDSLRRTHDVVSISGAAKNGRDHAGRSEKAL